MPLRTVLAALLFSPVLLLADLQFSAGSNFASVYTIEDPVTSAALPSGNAVYLIYDVDGDGAVGDVDGQTGAVLAPDILLRTYTIGEGAFAPFTSGGLSGRLDLPTLNAALGANGNAVQGQLYLRVFNVDDPTTANIANGDVYYGDSYASDASVITEASPWTEVGGFFRYDLRDDDSPVQPQWTLGTIVLNRQLQIPNVPPVANAGTNQILVDGDGDGSETVLLDGSASTDSDGSIVSWNWLLAGNSVGTGAMPSVTLNVGTYTIDLVVLDNEGGSSSSNVSVTVEGNLLPVANAGGDQSALDLATNGSEVVSLDGSQSSDADGSIVSWHWTIGGTNIATGATPNVTLPVGTYDILLTVTDDDGGTATDTSVVTIVENLALLAVAGPAQTLIAPSGSSSALAQLDGTGSIAEGTIVSWIWSEGSQQIATGALASVAFPIGVHTVQLTVMDHLGAMDDDSLVVTVVPNQIPTVDAGSDQSMIDADDNGSEVVNLDGSQSSDLDGTIVSWDWTIAGNSIATGATPNVTLAIGTYAIILTVTDDLGGTATDTSVVTIVENLALIAVAGPDQTLIAPSGSPSALALLDGTGSIAEGTIVSWIWSEGSQQIATGAVASVAFPIGVHTVQLTVVDHLAAMHDDSLVVTVVPNQVPTVDAGSDQSMIDTDDNGSEVVSLDGSQSSDPDGSIVSWDWTIAGSSIASGATPNVTLAIGTHVITLTVSDALGGIATETMSVTILEQLDLIAVAGPDQLLQDADDDQSEIALLDGSGTIAEGTIVSWTWQVDGQLAATSAVASVALPVGVHTAQLTVVDQRGAAHSDELIVTVLANEAPLVDAGSDQTLSDSDWNGSEMVGLNATVAMDPDGSVDSIEWVSGGSVIATGSSATVLFPLGTTTVQLVVTDNGGLTTSDELNIVVASPANTSPSFGNYGVQRVVVNDPFILPLEGTDAEVPAQTLTYSLLGPVPAGLVIDAATGHLSWTPATNQVGSTSVVVQVTDGFDTTTTTLQFSIAEVPYIQSFLGFVSGGGEQVLGFAAKSGFQYQLQHSPTLENPVWTTFVTMTAETSSENVPFTESGNTVGYFRVLVIPDGSQP